MSDESRTDRDGTANQASPSRTASDRLLTESDVLEADLPDDLGTALENLLGGETIDTLGDWIEAVRRRTGGGSIEIADLCHDSEGTGHWGDLDGERYHFTCFYDAVILAAMAEEPVDVRTVSPDGAEIEARAAGSTDLTVTPENAVFSFGVADGADPQNGEPTRADVYGAVCPYVRAFPEPDAYERWAQSVPATTIAMPLVGATEVAAALTE